MRNTFYMAQLTTGLLVVCATSLGAADYPATVLADNPPGYWRLDSLPIVEQSYATNIGTAGAALNGVIGNFTREGIPGAVAGDADTAMQFIGNGNSRIVVPYDPSLNQGGSFTFECWINPAVPLGPALALVVNRAGESGYTVYINGDGSFGFNMNRGPGGGYWSSVSITNTDAVARMVGKWTHIACVYDQDAGSTGFGTQSIYTNGVLAVLTEIQDAPWVPNDSGPFVLADRGYAGLMDEVAAYSTALTPQRLLAHYQAGTSGQGQYQATVLADNPEGYWRLNETGGFMPEPAIATNSVAGGMLENGSYDLGVKLQQPGALAGSTDTAAYFDSTKILQVPAGVTSQKGAPLTVEFWAKPAVAYAGGTAQACVLASTDRDNGRSGWLFYQGGNGWSWWLGTNSSTTYTVQLDPTTPVSVDNWYHVVGSYDGTTARLYVNGVEAQSKVGTFSPNLSKPLTVGGRYDYALGYQGSVDEVAVYPAVLSAADVLAHYQNGTNSARAQSYDALIISHNPQAYWRLNDPPGTAAPGVANSGWLGSVVDGSVVGTMELSTDKPLANDSNPSVDFTAGGRIAIPFDPALNRTDAFSYEVWYKQTGGTGSSHRSPLWWRDEPTLGDTRGWVHYVVGEGNTFQSSDVYTTWNGLDSNMLFAQDEWQHLVSTFDGKTKKMYLNGVLIAVSTNAVLAVKPVTRPVTTISSASYPWIGNLDEVAIYTNALSSERVQAHYIAARNANPPAVAPTFRLNIVSTNFFEGSELVLPAIALGTEPFTYQWYKGTTAIVNQTNANLLIPGATEADSGDYKLRVTNAGGSLESDVATILVEKAPPTIVTEPRPAVRLQGSSVTFAVASGGSLPLVYQWHSNNVAIPGANEAAFTLNNVQPSFAADYQVTITNTAGSANSQLAKLEVVPVTPGSVAATVVAAEPMAYWRLNETSGTVAHDYVGGYDGTYDAGVTLGQPSGLLGDTDGSANFAYTGVTVPFTVDLNPYTTFSLEAWVKPDPSGMGTDRPILWSRTSYSGWAYGYVLSADASDSWSFTTGQKTSGFDTITAPGATNSGWTHLVATFSDATGEKKLYVNGQLAAQTTTATGTFAPNQVTPDNALPPDQGIGWDPVNFTGFYGGLDEVVFYDYALSPAEIQAHYAAATAPTLNITSVGGNVILTWGQGLLLQANEVTGPWTTNSAATSPYTVTPSENRRFYRTLVP